ncbi:hypothetical protein BU23DRAFT_559996 [Bimuria novae-zelandiae CBS 107.79]|uniref:Zn(2)-C6 fungal-type domain-containing protein n=1 Tax=Bimuria novae-zelandiae CBS 107.79 TaxID=1447943 RepID=A0A6A5URX7_9PLEO|nr:hypothetical protein BU23DRAFT_559996 [Bimuria novae-zelandiae CBS 107.79]
MPRLGHKKSRTGCRQCKARHVKCDELKPCSNCARHGVLCSLVDPNAPPPVPAPSNSSGSSSAPKKTGKTKTELQDESTSAAIPSTNVDQSSEPSDADSPRSGSDHFPFITTFVKRRSISEADLWLLDLEAMHHWMTDGVDTLSLSPHSTHIWRTVVSREGLKHTFLLHQILALSSFQLSHTKPDRRADYYAAGTHHQDNALGGMRKHLQNITDDNAPAAFAASTLIPISVFASRGLDAVDSDTEANNPLDDLADIFNLIQGIGRVMAAAQMGIIMSGPFQHLFKDPAYETAPQPLFHKMLEQLPALTELFDENESLDEDTRRDLLAFVTGMRQNLLRCSKPCMENRDIKFLFYWPFHLSPNFMFGLRQRSPGALVLVMYWAIILSFAARTYWFLRGWTDRITQAVTEELTEQPWKEAIEWPIQLIEAQRVTSAAAVPEVDALAI